MNHSYMKAILILKSCAKSGPHDIIVSYHKPVRYGNKSLQRLSPKIWDQLPLSIKAETCFAKFKEYIKSWFGPSCKSSFCKLI